MKMGVLSSFLAITIGLLAAAFITGINTNEKISVESNSFEEISLLYEAGEFEEVIHQIEELEKNRNQSDALLHYMKGIAMANTGRASEASLAMYEVLKIDPHYVDREIFMLQFLEILLMVEDFERAEKVLERCRGFERTKVSGEFVARINELAVYMKQRGYGQ